MTLGQEFVRICVKAIFQACPLPCSKQIPRLLFKQPPHIVCEEENEILRAVNSQNARSLTEDLKDSQCEVVCVASDRPVVLK